MLTDDNTKKWLDGLKPGDAAYVPYRVEVARRTLVKFAVEGQERLERPTAEIERRIRVAGLQKQARELIASLKVPKTEGALEWFVEKLTMLKTLGGKE